jgi:hypothetical protein
MSQRDRADFERHVIEPLPSALDLAARATKRSCREADRSRLAGIDLDL